MPQNKQEISKELQDALIDILKSYEKEDTEIRKVQIRSWKKNEEYWRGVQYLFWSNRDETWRSAVDVNLDSDENEASTEAGSFYDYVINIFRGHGEAIIAALAAQIPALRFVPDNADDSDDLLTARTYDKIGDLIQRHNKIKILALKAFYFLYLNGIVASYIYKDSDFKYGSYKIPEFGTEEQDSLSYTCPNCSSPLPEGSGELTEVQCPECGEIVKPKGKEEKVEVPVNKGYKELPKTRVKIDLFGGLQVKIPIYARTQEECPYLILYTDIPKEVAIDIYPDLEDEIVSDHIESYDRFSRTDYTFPTDPEVTERNLITIPKMWMRVSAFNKITDKKLRAEAKEKFPSGCRLEVLGRNKVFGAAVEEDLDSRWRVGQAGLSPYIHSDPICTPVISPQDMRNTLTNLSIGTIEHGISAVFADPRVVNFDIYEKFEADPGCVYKTLPQSPNKNIGDGFYAAPKSQLGAEVAEFGRQLDQDAQFVLGSFPSIYGGPSTKDRSTLGEYTASRQIALQRLQIAWTFFVDWFKVTIENAVRLYVDVIVEDENFVVKEQGNYVNVWIRQAELSGKVGGCESEADSSFPVSLAQKKSVIMELMQLNDDFVKAALYSPENAQVLQDILALNELNLPGDAQRTKQMLEIKELCKSEPISEGIPSVPIEPDIDDDAVHIATVRSFLVGAGGLDLKRINPLAYMNNVFHMKAHMMNLQMKTAGQNATPAGEQPETSQLGVE